MKRVFWLMMIGMYVYIAVWMLSLRTTKEIIANVANEHNDQVVKNDKDPDQDDLIFAYVVRIIPPWR